MPDAIAPEGVAPDQAEEVAAEAEAEEVEAAEGDAAEAEAESQDADEQADAEDGDDQDEQSDDEPEEEPEDIEFNFNGDKLRVPKDALPEELATKVDHFVRNAEAATTRKLQEVSEQRKALTDRETAVEKLMSLSGEALDNFSRGQHLQREIEQLSQIDLNAVWQSNPDQARRISDTLSQKQAEFSKVVQSVTAKEAELSEAQKAEIDRQKQEGTEVLERRIKGFKAEKLPIVLDYAVDKLGMDRKAAESDWALNPAITEAVYKAALWDRAQETTKKSSPKPAKAKPVKARKVGTGGNGTLDLVKDAGKLSPDEWARRRNEQLRKKGRL